MEQVYTPKDDYKVFVRCNTFNQSKYIEDALKGFAMQQTNFPFVCLVMDDCSTDGEQDVIKTWMEHVCDMDKAEYIEIELSHIILVPHKSNANCYFAFYLLKRNTWKERNLKVAMYTPWREHCQYEALCEGDDYWIDPNKLQKQVDFLDNNPNYSMCFHKSNIIKEVDIDCALRVDLIDDKNYNGTELVDHWIVPTASMVMRQECYHYPIKNREKLINGDLPLVLSCCAMGKVRGFSDSMSIYRVQVGGVTYDKSKRKEYNIRFPEHYRCLHENFPFVDKKVINRLIAYHQFEIGKDETIVIRKLRYFARSFISSPSYATLRFINILKRTLTKH